VLGGARSGKSRYALTLAHPAQRVLFVATAEPGDEEMAMRIAAHRRERPAAWDTLEAPRRVGEAIDANYSNHEVVIVDCLTLLISNIHLALGEAATTEQAERAVLDEIKVLLEALRRIPARWIVISNEVGMGVVPMSSLARTFCDVLGRANQHMALAADDVVLMVAGLAWSLTRRGPS